MASPKDITIRMRIDAIQHTSRAPSGWWRATAPDFATIAGNGKLQPKPKLIYLGGRFKTQEAAVEAVVRFWTGERDLATFIVERVIDGKRLFIPSVGRYRVEPWGSHHTMFLAQETRLLAECAARALLFALFVVNRKYPPAEKDRYLAAREKVTSAAPSSDPPPVPGSREYFSALRFVRRSEHGKFSATVYPKGKPKCLGTFGKEPDAVQAVLRFRGKGSS